MRRLSKLYVVLVAMVVCSALVAGVLTSCSDDDPAGPLDGAVEPKKDKSKQDQYVYPDITKPDRTIYPDIRKPADVRPWVHAEGSTGWPFTSKR